MSIHRTAARRDANEPTIRKRFAHHGWHTEQMSGAGMPDLLCFPPQRHINDIMRGVPFMVPTLADVKMPDGKVTPAQEEKWKALREKGIPVYVVRAADDVDALVRGDLEAWEPDAVKLRKGLAVAEAIRTWPLSTGTAVPDSGSFKRLARNLRTRSGYTPPRSKPVDAAKEAEVFAPPPRCASPKCPALAIDGLFCKDHAP